MKIKISITGILMLGILAGGCSKPSLEPFGKVELAPSIKPVSDIQKAETAEIEKFEPGSTLGTYVWTGELFGIPHVSNHLSTIGKDGRCTSDTPLQWMGQDEAHYFLSISPAPSQQIRNFSYYKYQLDATDMKKNDLMVAINDEGLNASATQVPLVFHHLMAQLKVTLEISSLIDVEPGQLTVAAKTRMSTAIDLTSEQPGVELHGNKGMMQLKHDSANPSEFHGILPPQNELTEIIVRLPGQKELETRVPKSIPLKSGMRTSIIIKVGPNEAYVENVTIGDWVPATGYDQNLEAPEPLQFSDVRIEGKEAADRAFGFFTKGYGNIKVTGSGTKWTGEKEILLNPENTEYTFFAYSPYQNSLKESTGHPGYFDYSLPTDQSEKTPSFSAWYSRISKTDLLKQGLDINFANQLSLLEVNIKTDGASADAAISNLKVSGVLTEAYFGINKDNDTAETVCYAETEQNARKSVTMMPTGSRKFRCTLLPQSNVPLKVNFLADGFNYEWVAAAPVSFQSNKMYNLEITLAEPQTKAGPAKPKAVISGNFRTR